MSAHPWYLGKLNKPTQAHDMTMSDILRVSGSDQWKQALQKEMGIAVAEKRYEAFIVDFKNFVLRPPDFSVYYELVESNLSGSALHPVTGWNRKPTYLYVRRTVQHRPKSDVDKPHY